MTQEMYVILSLMSLILLLKFRTWNIGDTEGSTAEVDDMLDVFITT